MSGLWVFNKNGVVHHRNPGGAGGRQKVLVHVPSNETITSYEALEGKLAELGWERYPVGAPELLQFHKRSSVHLISLPRDFSKLRSVHMYDIVVKSRNVFEVRDG